MADWQGFAKKLRALEVKAFSSVFYEDNGYYCAVGAFVPEYIAALEPTCPIVRPRFEAPHEVIEGEGGNTALDGSEAQEEAAYLLHKLLQKRTGLERYDLARVQMINDKCGGTPEERYKEVLQAVLELARSA